MLCVWKSFMLERECNFNRDKNYSPCIDRIRNKLAVLTFNFSKKPLSITIDKTIISSTFSSDTMIPKKPDDKYMISNYIPASIRIYFYNNVTREKLVMKNLIKIYICVRRIRLCTCLYSSSCCFPVNRIRDFVIVNRYS